MTEILKDKKSYGVNGDHARLGSTFSDKEFKGYVVAKLEELAKVRTKVEWHDKMIYIGIGGLTVLTLILQFFF